MAEIFHPQIPSKYINDGLYDMKGAEVLTVKSNPGGYINIDQYPGMAGKEVLQPHPDSLTGEVEEVKAIPDKKSKKKLIASILVGSGLTILAAIGLSNCNAGPTPILPPTPEPTSSPEPTMIPTTEPTAIPATPTIFPIVQPTATVQPIFNYDTYYDQTLMPQGSFRWEMLAEKIDNSFPDMDNHPNLRNDLTTAAAELSLVHDGILPGQAWTEPISTTVSIPGVDILIIEKDCLEGDAPKSMNELCADVLVTSGSNLDADNLIEDKAYQAARRIDQSLPAILEGEINK